MATGVLLPTRLLIPISKTATSPTVRSSSVLSPSPRVLSLAVDSAVCVIACFRGSG